MRGAYEYIYEMQVGTCRDLHLNPSILKRSTYFVATPHSTIISHAELTPNAERGCGRKSTQYTSELAMLVDFEVTHENAHTIAATPPDLAETKKKERPGG